MRGYLCGTPKENCTGGNLMCDQHLHTTKVHQSHEEAMKCYKRYLINILNYTQLSSREFQIPGGEVLVLTKVSHFGGVMRKGKNEKGGKKRLMPKYGRGLVY